MPETAAVLLDAIATPPPGALLPLRTQALTLELRGRRLIDAVDLELADNGRTVVMGPNGAGKSLLLRLLHGLIAPTAGRVEWPMALSERELRRRQAMVFQRPVLLRRSVAANVEYALAVQGLSRAERRERAWAALRAAQLEHLAERPARILSGGEQQRLAVARALAIRPDVLFLDEPTANLDPASTLAIEELIGSAHEAGTKIIFVTHDIGQAKRLADDVVFLHAGRLGEHSPAERFFSRPRCTAAEHYLAGRLIL